MVDDKKPDQIRVEAFLESARFEMGLGDKWSEPTLIWPHLLVNVRAGNRDGSPTHYTFRFDLSDYPTNAPTAGVWDRAKNAAAAADDFPGGGDLIQAVFQPGQSYLYLPCDRLANLAGHPEWRTTHPELVWSPSKDLTLYLDEIHRLLNSKNYTGIRRPRPADELPS